MPSKYTTAFVLGRFQPFHKGHMHLIKQALLYCNNIIIGIGSANKKDENNPFDVAARKEMIETALLNAGLLKYVEKIVALDDNPDDDIWLQQTLAKTGNIDVIIGNNEWPNEIFEKAGYPVIRIPLYKRHLYEGQKIRTIFTSKKTKLTST